MDSLVGASHEDLCEIVEPSSSAVPAPRTLVAVIGVSGTGKCAVGAALAEALAVDFLDGDGLHATASVAKMAVATPLTDEDRSPWLQRIGDVLLTNRLNRCTAAEGDDGITCTRPQANRNGGLKHQSGTICCTLFSMMDEQCCASVPRASGFRK